MSLTSTSAARAAVPAALLIAAGCVVAMLNFGPRSSMGFFMAPVMEAGGFGRDVFSLAFAVQNLVWGVAQPFAGAVADKYGTTRVLIGGAAFYAVGLALMSVSTDPTLLVLTSGVLIGFGLAGASFNVVLAAFAKLLPPEKRAMGLGFGTAAGSFGQFLFTPLAPALIDGAGWQATLVAFGLLQLLVLPLAFLLWTAPAGDRGGAAESGPQSLTAALKEALAHPSYVLLVLGFFTCGFQLAFITGHLPQYLLDKGLGTIELFGRSVSAGGLTLALIGLFNIAGSLAAGWLVSRVPRRWLLAVIYTLRSVAIAAFVLLPVTPASSLIFGASMGLLWLSTVPPTSALVALMFGVRYMSMLYGFVFFSHQVGGFLGAWLGGVLYEATRSYDPVWWLSVALGIASAVINLPIRERPVDRPLAPAPARP